MLAINQASPAASEVSGDILCQDGGAVARTVAHTPMPSLAGGNTLQDGKAELHSETAIFDGVLKNTVIAQDRVQVLSGSEESHATTRTTLQAVPVSSAVSKGPDALPSSHAELQSEASMPAAALPAEAPSRAYQSTPAKRKRADSDEPAKAPKEESLGLDATELMVLEILSSGWGGRSETSPVQMPRKNSKRSNATSTASSGVASPGTATPTESPEREYLEPRPLHLWRKTFGVDFEVNANLPCQQRVTTVHPKQIPPRAPPAVRQCQGPSQTRNGLWTS